MRRRRFVMRGLELVIAAHCLPLLDESAAALQPRSAVKPPLTEATLNAMIPKETDQLRAFVRQMFPDMRAFIRSRFTLSGEQERALDAISASWIERTHKALEAAVARGGRVSVASVTTPGATTDPRVDVVANADLRISARCLHQSFAVR